MATPKREPAWWVRVRWRALCVTGSIQPWRRPHPKRTCRAAHDACTHEVLSAQTRSRSTRWRQPRSPCRPGVLVGGVSARFLPLSRETSTVLRLICKELLHHRHPRNGGWFLIRGEGKHWIVMRVPIGILLPQPWRRVQEASRGATLQASQFHPQQASCIPEIITHVCCYGMFIIYLVGIA